DLIVTGVQTCALPICRLPRGVPVWTGRSRRGSRGRTTGVAARSVVHGSYRFFGLDQGCIQCFSGVLLVSLSTPVDDRQQSIRYEIGRASCRERVMTTR